MTADPLAQECNDLFSEFLYIITRATRSHFKSRLSLIVRVNVGLLLLTVTDVSTTCAVVIFRVKVSCITSVDGMVIDLIGQLRRD